ncbi:MAG TPA: hypothetical protein VD788_08755, partial [Candidatus Polarisedimenticolaceae bacterium]|nr:hypothetical protein [Candidatus Polarisedimenticolaceae bacterium]
MISFLRSSLLRYVAPAFLGTAAAACDPGYVEAVFLYKGDPPVLGPDATTFARVERRTDPLKPGEPVTTVATSPYAQHGGPIPTIPYGDDLVIIIEVRLSPDPAGQVVLYGISDRFSVRQGDHIRVPILLHPRPPPEPLPGDSSLVIVTSTRAPGYTNRRRVELHLFAPESAVKARVSNLVDLPEDGSVVFDLAELQRVESATAGYPGYRVPAWTLDVESCPDTGRCRLNVYTRFTDNQEYSGPPAAASVTYDDVPPSLIPGLTSIFPPVARDDVRISVNLTASETIFSPRLAVAQRVDFPLVRVSPAEDQPGAAFTFSSTHTAGSIGRDGTFLVRADLVDLAGNVARLVEVGSFTVDTIVPEIGGVTVEPRRINGE